MVGDQLADPATVPMDPARFVEDHAHPLIDAPDDVQDDGPAVERPRGVESEIHGDIGGIGPVGYGWN